MTVEPGVTPPPPTPTKPYKAIIAFVLAFLGALYTITADRTDLDTLGAKGWLTVILTAAITAGATYVVPNPAKGARRRVL